jgi:uncharacterized protein YbjT (DUF2867 family)
MSKFVITGGAGNVSKPLTEILLAKGHEVTVVGRHAEKLGELVGLGAKAAIGDLSDVSFLTKTFEGAEGVYLLIPPSWDSPSIKQTSVDLAVGYVRAIQDAGVKNVVYLSSYGAHRLDDAGAISGMGLGEVVLNSLKGVNVLHLRAGYFYTNFNLQLQSLKGTGSFGNMYSIEEKGTFTLVDPYDIAVVAANALHNRDFNGHSFVYVVSDETDTDEVTALIGRETGIPDLKWEVFPAEDFRSQLLGYGFNPGAAADYVEMFTTLGTGLLFEDYLAGGHKAIGATKVEEFAKRFGERYKQL